MIGRVKADFRPNSMAAKGEAGVTHQKALQINLDPRKYGAFAEIG